MVHFLEWPGLVSIEDSKDQALSGAPLALARYAGWCGFHKGTGPDVSGVVKIEVAAEIEIPGDCGTGDPVGTFDSDREPLDDRYRDCCLERLGWAFEDLLEIVEGLKPEKLEWVPPGRQRSLGEEFAHVAGTLAWLPGRIGLAPEADAGETAAPAEVLRRAHQRFRARMLGLTEAVRAVETTPPPAPPGVEGEAWTARKVCRRAAEHSLEHLFNLYRHMSAGGAEKEGD